MNIKRSIKYLKSNLYLLFFVLSLGLHAQKDTIYADENDFPISKEIFNKKLSAPIYYGLRFDTDTLVLQKIKLRYDFGEITPNTKHQLFKLLNKRHQIDTTKTLVIHYQDTLKAMSEFPKQSKVVYYDSLDNEIKTLNKVTRNPYGMKIDLSNYKKVVKHKHIQSYKSFLYWNKKCNKSYKKYDKTAAILHFYNFNTGHPNVVNNLTWYQDYGSLLKKLFFQDKKKFYTVIIKPSGAFYLEHYESYFTSHDLLNPEKWNTIKADFDKRYKALNNTNI